MGVSHVEASRTSGKVDCEMHTYIKDRSVSV